MRADVKINDLWMFAMGWLREEIDFPMPQSQTNTVVVPGRNAPIRFTEALGRVSYQPRSFSITLSMLGSREKFNQMKDLLANLYAGQLCQVILSEELDLYALGTLELEPAYGCCPARMETLTVITRKKQWSLSLVAARRS